MMIDNDNHNKRAVNLLAEMSPRYEKFPGTNYGCFGLIISLNSFFFENLLFSPKNWYIFKM